MNCRIGASMPGMAISANCAPFAIVYSGGLNSTGITGGRFGPRSRGSTSIRAGTVMSASRPRRFRRLPVDRRRRLIAACLTRALLEALEDERHDPLDLRRGERHVGIVDRDFVRELAEVHGHRHRV